MNVSFNVKVAANILDQALSSSPYKEPKGDISPEKVLSILKNNRISLIFLRERAKSASAWLREAPSYENELMRQQQHLKVVKSYYEEVVSEFDYFDIDHLLIKSVGFFPHETSNVDILVHWENLADARKILIELGYIQQSRYIRPDKFLYANFVGDEKKSLVHLHTRVSWGPPFFDEKDIWKYCKRSANGFFYPCAEDAFMITIAENFYEDSEFDLWDLAKLRLCNPFELDWDDIFNKTSRWGWENGMAISLLILNRTHESLYNRRSLLPDEIKNELTIKINSWEGTQWYWTKWSKQPELSLPIKFPKIFTKAHAYLTSIRSQPTPWRLKVRDMNLLSRWASETLFGIRMRRPFLVVFTGPDGSGKTTLAEAGMLALEATAEKPKFVWLRVGDSPVLNFLKKFVRTHIEVTSNEKKFGGELKSSVLQTIWLWLSAMDWFFRSFFLIRIPLWLRRIVICDRYLVDALVDLSYRSSWDKVRKSKLIRMLIRLTPQPDIIFQCIAPADIILNRRSNEITEVDANQIVKSYSKAKKYLHKSVPIDSTQPEEKNKTAVVYKILKDYYASYESKKS